MALTELFLNRRSSADSEATAQLIVELWSTIAQGFRQDEQPVEGDAYRKRTAQLREELAQLPPGKGPDAAMQRRMMETLLGCVRERVSSLHERIDELDASLRQRDAELRTQQLHASWMQDEMERCRAMLVRDLRRRGLDTPAGDPPLLSHLLAAATTTSRPTPIPAAV
ncbi:MAG: hypothetical protein J0M02_08710 [Planctomycetes bacterium]|nr:hypothetical protein [Planctomycetota bacterium]